MAVLNMAENVISFVVVTRHKAAARALSLRHGAGLGPNVLAQPENLLGFKPVSAQSEPLGAECSVNHRNLNPDRPSWPCEESLV